MLSRFFLSAACFLAVFPISGTAQQAVPSGDLRQEVDRLAAQQTEILKRLDEIKAMMKGPNAPPEIKQPNNLSIAGEPVRGQASAPVIIVEYGDFECPFCRRFERDTYPQLLKQYIETGKVRFVHRDLPLPFHAHALPAAEAARCAGAQGRYWPMYDSLFSGEVPAAQGEIDDRARKLGLDTGKLDACVDAKQFSAPIQHDQDEAGQLNISGTPTFLIGTAGAEPGTVRVQRTVVGAQPFSVFQGAVDGLLAPAPARAGGQ